MDLSQTTL